MTDESIWSSKTMILVALAMGVVILLVAVAVAVEILFHVAVFDVIAAAISAVVALAGSGTWRNVRVDGPVRMAQAQQAYPPQNTEREE